MGIMTSSCDVTARDNDGIEIPTKNTYPYSYSSLRDTYNKEKLYVKQLHNKIFGRTKNWF